MTPTPESVEKLATRLEFKAQSSFEMNHRAGRKGKEWALETEIEWQAAQLLRTLSAQVADRGDLLLKADGLLTAAEAENAALREQVGALREYVSSSASGGCATATALIATLQATQQKEGK